MTQIKNHFIRLSTKEAHLLDKCRVLLNFETRAETVRWIIAKTHEDRIKKNVTIPEETSKVGPYVVGIRFELTDEERENFHGLKRMLASKSLSECAGKAIKESLFRLERESGRYL